MIRDKDNNPKKAGTMGSDPQNKGLGNLPGKDKVLTQSTGTKMIL